MKIYLQGLLLRSIFLTIAFFSVTGCEQAGSIPESKAVVYKKLNTTDKSKWSSQQVCFYDYVKSEMDLKYESASVEQKNYNNTVLGAYINEHLDSKLSDNADPVEQQIFENLLDFIEMTAAIAAFTDCRSTNTGTSEGSFTCTEGDCNNGKGKILFADGNKYIGGFKDGVYDGHGSLGIGDGAFYLGDFKAGLFHGDGQLFQEDGTYYVGEFKKGMLHGQGRLTSLSGYTYVGEFKEDKFYGQGDDTDKSGREYYEQPKKERFESYEELPEDLRKKFDEVTATDKELQELLKSQAISDLRRIATTGESSMIAHSEAKQLLDINISTKGLFMAVIDHYESDKLDELRNKIATRKVDFGLTQEHATQMIDQFEDIVKKAINHKQNENRDK